MYKNLTLIAILSFVLMGCAGQPQMPIALDKSALLNVENRVGVAMDNVPEPSLYLPGADCLLCMAAAATANAKLSKHVKSFSTEEIIQLKGNVVDSLKAQGKEVVIIDDYLNINDLPKLKTKGDNLAKYDFSSLADKHQINQLLVIDINFIGAMRPYASYIPTGDPEVSITGVSYLVDLQSNAYQWYLPVNLRRSSDGQWKEPPEFPGLTNAYYHLLDQVKDTILNPLSIN